ncbi:MAG: nitroreductase/quinone reductase family protein [Candidatus Binatia bacterium]
MKVLKVLLIVLVVYVAIVATFESSIGFFQPAPGSTLVITTLDADGTPHDRVVARLETEGKLYVSANHWPRAWYRRALANPEVRITMDGETRDVRAVSVTGAEHDRVAREHPHSLAFRIVTGFPTRYFVRLDPR